MEKVTTEWDELLLRYVDNDLDTTAQKKVAFEIEKSVELQNRLVEIKAIHDFLAGNAKLEMPAKNFTEKVMQGLSVRPSYSFLSPRNGLLLLIGIISMCSLGFILLLAVQIVLGILTLLNATYTNRLVWLGVSHQFTAMLLLMLVTALLFVVRKK